MPLRLSDYDQALLHGEEGPAARMAMSIMARMVGIYGADQMMDITAAHIDSTVYMGEATMEFAERLAALGAKVKVPSTLNVSGVDEHGWQQWAVPSTWAENAYRQMVAYKSMGCIATWTCAPYQTEHRPVFGQQIASGESNAIAFFNSVIGARTERYPDLLDICAAITGRVPAAGLHLTENRAGDMLLQLEDIPLQLQEDDAFYPVLGHYLGRVAPNRIPVVEGLAVQPTEDQFKALGAGAASSGAVALFHIVGATPEAPTAQDAFQGKPPQQTRRVTMADLRKARDELTTASGTTLDMVVLGSPHFSLQEFKKLAPLVAGRTKHPKVRFLVTCSRMVRSIAEKTGVLDPFYAFGGTITVDTCPLTSPMLPESVINLMTNSAKYAYYSPGLLNAQVTYGRLEDCVASAITGHIQRDDSLWQSR